MTIIKIREIANYIITISINDEKYEILITENELLEPKGPI